MSPNLKLNNISDIYDAIYDQGSHFRIILGKITLSALALCLGR